VVSDGPIALGDSTKIFLGDPERGGTPGRCAQVDQGALS